VRSKAEVCRHVEDQEARDVAMVAPGPLERLAFALLVSLWAEHSSPLAHELVAVDDASVAWIVNDADPRLGSLLLLRGFELHRLPPHDQKLSNNRPRTNASHAASWTRTLVTPVRNTAWRYACEPNQPS